MGFPSRFAVHTSSATPLDAAASADQRSSTTSTPESAWSIFGWMASPLTSSRMSNQTSAYPLSDSAMRSAGVLFIHEWLMKTFTIDRSG